MNKKELRQFGYVFGTALAVVFGGLVPWLWDMGYPAWPWLVGTLMIMVGALVPAALWPVHVVWMRMAKVIGAVNTVVILGAVYFVLLSPMGMVMRKAGRNAMDDSFASDARSYRKTSEVRDASHMENPY